MTADLPRITVVIPTYNLGRILRYALESVLMQDFPGFEVLVVGDGCTDGTETVVRSFGDPRIRWINLPDNSGTPSRPRNEALKRARGEYIAYLGHDDLWFPWHLSELLRGAEETGCDFVYSIGVIVRPGGVKGAFTMVDDAWDGKFILSPSNWLHRRTLTDRIGPWSPRVRHGDDRDFVRRMEVHGIRTVFRSRLTAVKFPAMSWGIYGLRSGFPQETCLDAMKKDPEGLNLSLLNDCAALLSRRETPAGESPYRGRLPVPLIRMARWFLAVYGQQRWPLNSLLFRVWKRKSGVGDPEE
jgi:glycosyltransferase involved in cell wall biosynthesis